MAEVLDADAIEKAPTERSSSPLSFFRPTPLLTSIG